ncbi:TIGR01244 family sulfur transferase [Sphingosinicella microcystinivorans]|uniref:TIGR01244 family sulfur transferase n=1 Tax=Sphingosinicella microcystinivorans TaxID=335406 RepID=UPI0030B8486F
MPGLLEETMFLKLSEAVSVAPQITAADVGAAKAAGFTAIINNRPDGEAPDQPPGETIAAAAAAEGLAYAHIPMSQGGITPGMIEAVRKALEGQTTLMFCRSGTRSTMLWGLAEASAGKDPVALAEAARAAGYDLSPICGVMQQMAAR